MSSETEPTALDHDLKLCYVTGPWAYFTTESLEEQWGDDWNDAPYQHNAGPPYDHRGQTIVRVAYDGPLYQPGTYERTDYDGFGDLDTRGVSVEDINRGRKRWPWLAEMRWEDGGHVAGVEIWAGSSLEEFVGLVESGGGRVYRAI